MARLREVLRPLVYADELAKARRNMRAQLAVLRYQNGESSSSKGAFCPLRPTLGSYLPTQYKVFHRFCHESKCKQYILICSCIDHRQTADREREAALPGCKQSSRPAKVRAAVRLSLHFTRAPPSIECISSSTLINLATIHLHLCCVTLPPSNPRQAPPPSPRSPATGAATLIAVVFVAVVLFYVRTPQMWVTALITFAGASRLLIWPAYKRFVRGPAGHHA